MTVAWGVVTFTSGAVKRAGVPPLPRGTLVAVICTDPTRPAKPRTARGYGRRWFA